MTSGSFRGCDSIVSSRLISTCKYAIASFLPSRFFRGVMLFATRSLTALFIVWGGVKNWARWLNGKKDGIWIQPLRMKNHKGNFAKHIATKILPAYLSIFTDTNSLNLLSRSWKWFFQFLWARKSVAHRWPYSVNNNLIPHERQCSFSLCACSITCVVKVMKLFISLLGLKMKGWMSQRGKFRKMWPFLFLVVGFLLGLAKLARFALCYA